VNHSRKKKKVAGPPVAGLSVCSHRRSGCAWNGEHLELHLEACKYRAVACRWCASSLKATVAVAHEQRCDRRTVRCGHCSEEMEARELEGHVDGPCKESPTGAVLCFCGDTVKRKDAGEHLRNDVAKHLRAQQERMEKQNERLEERIVQLERQRTEDTRRGEEMRHTLAMVTSLRFVWRVRLEPEPTKRVLSEPFSFGSLTLRFGCAWESECMCSLSLCPLVAEGPLVAACVVATDGVWSPVSFAVRSDGQSQRDGQWSDNSQGFSFALPPAQPDGMRELCLTLTRGNSE
jgi:hypothetical protein